MNYFGCNMEDGISIFYKIIKENSLMKKRREKIMKGETYRPLVAL